MWLCIVAVAIGTGEKHQARKHDYGDVLPKFGLATAPWVEL